MTRRHPYTTTPYGSGRREPFSLDDPEEVVLPLHPEEANPEFDPEAGFARSGDSSQKERAKQETWQEAWEAMKAEHAAEAPEEHGKAQPVEAAPLPCPLCADAEKARLLALAELENSRKRLAREKEDFLRYAGESILADILPALDNLDLALAYAPEGKECKNFVVGVDMTRKLLLDALARHGLEQVGELGETFEPSRHEAVDMVSNQNYQSGQVCALMTKGYKLKDRLLRPAKVAVCKND